jgi:uncharacterized membrane protein
MKTPRFRRPHAPSRLDTNKVQNAGGHFRQLTGCYKPGLVDDCKLALTSSFMKTINILLTTLGLSLSQANASAASWTITDLGLQGASGSGSQAWSINNLGQVVGRGRVLIEGTARSRIVLWSGGIQQDLGLNADSSLAGAKINDGGLVAINDGNWKPWLWQDGVITALPLLPGATSGGVHGINTGGTVVGFNSLSGGGVSVLWQAGTVSDTGLPGGPDMWAVAINDGGTLAVSRARRGDLSYLLASGSPSYLTVAGMTPDGTTAVKDVNNAGQACGDFHLNLGQTGTWHACLWTGPSGTPLPEFPYGGSAAVAMNHPGHVVGSAWRAPHDAPALLWRAGSMTVLNDLPEVIAAGWSQLTASDINDQDQIVGWGYRNGNLSAFLLSPVTVTPAPVPLTITRDGSNLVLSFPTTAGFSYQIQSSIDLSPASWVNSGAAISGTGGVLDRSIPIGPEPAMYFRLRID